jgi:hypothetical protein
MFATVLLDPPTTFLAGAIIALIGTKLIAKFGAAEVWKSGLFALAWSLLYGLAVGWMYFIRTDWMYVYLIDASQLPLVPTYLAFLVVMLTFGFAGALSVGHLIQNGRFWLAVGLTVLALFSLLMVFLVTGKQYMAIGSTAEFWSGASRKLTDDAEAMRAVNGITLGIVAGSLPILILRIRALRRL